MESRFKIGGVDNSLFPKDLFGFTLLIWKKLTLRVGTSEKKEKPGNTFYALSVGKIFYKEKCREKQKMVAIFSIKDNII